MLGTTFHRVGNSFYLLDDKNNESRFCVVAWRVKNVCESLPNVFEIVCLFGQLGFCLFMVVVSVMIVVLFFLCAEKWLVFTIIIRWILFLYVVLGLQVDSLEQALLIPNQLKKNWFISQLTCGYFKSAEPSFLLYKTQYYTIYQHTMCDNSHLLNCSAWCFEWLSLFQSRCV